MSGSKPAGSNRPEPYWFALIPLLVAGTALYGWHLTTGLTPDKTAVTVLGFDVYWYGIIITAGIGLGAYVATRLARERAERLLGALVPLDVRLQPVADLGLPQEITQILQKRRVTELGPLLLRFAWHPSLGLNEAGRQTVAQALRADENIEEAWIDNPPWRPWNPDHVWGISLWMLVLAIVGARLYHVLTPSPSLADVGIEGPLDYFRQPYQLINLRNGGLGIYGGIVGGMIGLAIYAWRQKLPILGWSDLGAPGLALGQAIGRWGNFINQELYGRPTNLPWAVTIDHPLDEYNAFSHFHPTFLYESLWNLGLFFILLRLARRGDSRLRTGDLTALYLLGYATGRFLLEFMRLNNRLFAIGGTQTPLSVGMLVSLVVAGAMGFLLWRRRPAS